MTKYICRQCRRTYLSKYLAEDCCKRSSSYSDDSFVSVGIDIITSSYDTGSSWSSSSDFSGGGGSFDGGGCSSNY